MKFDPILSSGILLLLWGCAESNFELKDASPNRPAVVTTEPQASPQNAALLPSPSPASEIPFAKRPQGNGLPLASTPIANPSLSPSPSPSMTPISASRGEIFDTPEIKFHADEAFWKKVSQDDGVDTYQERAPKQDVVAFRGETRMPTTLKRIAAVLSNPDIRKEWVDALLETRTLAILSSFERIEYNHTQVPWPFQDRDFVYRVKVKVNQNPAAMLITMTSIEDPREPVHDGIVRGQILNSYYYMKEIPGPSPSTQVAIEMALDPKGAIPLWMVNLTQKKWPHNTLLALKKTALRPDLVVPKEIEDYFSHYPGGKNEK